MIQQSYFLVLVYPKELKSGSQKDTCAPMFIAALFKKGNTLNVY